MDLFWDLDRDSIFSQKLYISAFCEIKIMPQQFARSHSQPFYVTTLSDAVDSSAPGHERSVEETVLLDTRPAVLPVS